MSSNVFDPKSFMKDSNKETDSKENEIKPKSIIPKEITQNTPKEIIKEEVPVVKKSIGIPLNEITKTAPVKPTQVKVYIPTIPADHDLGEIEVLKPEKKHTSETTAVIDYLPEIFDVLGTKARQVARPDLPVQYYLPRAKTRVVNGEEVQKVVSRTKGNFDLYNFDLDEKLSAFSAENQQAGGVAITRSQVTEACLDFIFYDLGLGPNGFKSTEDLRNHLRSLMK